MPSLLYVGDGAYAATSVDRANALGRLGASVEMLAIKGFEPGVAGQIDRQMARRLQMGSWVKRANECVLDAASKPHDIVWLDKPWMLWPQTVAALKRRGTYVVLFNNDNPWGRLERGLWRLLLGSIRHVDLVVTPRNASVPSYLASGAKRVRVVDFGFEAGRQVPPDESFKPAQVYDVSFIGTATSDGGDVRPDRAEFLSQVAGRLPGRVAIFGNGWKKYASHLKLARSVGGGQFGSAYNEVIWSSRISLSFVNWTQADETSHRAFEITACRGLLLAERSPGLELSFQEDKEALFFANADECVEKIQAVLDNRIDREAIARAGHVRTMQSGYDNDSRLRTLIQQTPELRRLFGDTPAFSRDAS